MDSRLLEELAHALLAPAVASSRVFMKKVLVVRDLPTVGPDCDLKVVPTFLQPLRI